MANYRNIVFNGRSFHDFGLYLTNDVDYFDVILPDINSTPIVGSTRGEAIQSLGRYKNKERTYSFKTIPSKMPCDEELFIQMFNDFITSASSGYKKLIDSNRNGYYCEAFIKEISKIERVYKNCLKVSITFSCKPFWRNITGDTTIKHSDTLGTGEPIEFTVINPDKYTAYPKFTINNGTTNISGFILRVVNTTGIYTFTVPSVSKTSITIDSEKLNTYSGSTPLNNQVSDDYLTLAPESNTVTFIPTGLSSPDPWTVSLKPRWRCY